MPTTWLFKLASGPPELPGLMGASAWIASNRNGPAALWGLLGSGGSWTVRPSALTTPCVTVGPPGSASALPMATTQSPICSWLESPSSATGKFNVLIWTTARYYGEVGLRVSASQRPWKRAPIGQLDQQPVGTGHDMIVRQDVPLAVVDNAGTDAGWDCERLSELTDLDLLIGDLDDGWPDVGRHLTGHGGEVSSLRLGDVSVARCGPGDHHGEAGDQRRRSRARDPREPTPTPANLSHCSSELRPSSLSVSKDA